jgi:UDP-glucose 6-dehydrogenase
LKEALESRLLTVARGPAEAVEASDATFIAVGTPSNPDGSIDAKPVLNTIASRGMEPG